MMNRGDSMEATRLERWRRGVHTQHGVIIGALVSMLGGKGESSIWVRGGGGLGEEVDNDNSRDFAPSTIMQ